MPNAKPPAESGHTARCRPAFDQGALALDLGKHLPPGVVAGRFVRDGEWLLHVELTIEHVQPILPAVLPKPLLTEPGRDGENVERSKIAPDVRDDELARAESSFPLLDGEERHVPEAEVAHGVAPRNGGDRFGFAPLELRHRAVRIR